MGSSGLGGLPGEHAVAPGDLHQLDGGIDMQLLLQAHLVGADGLVADGQLLGDMLIGHALGQQLQHRQLARGKLGDFIGVIAAGFGFRPVMHGLPGKIAAPMQHRRKSLDQLIQLIQFVDEAVRPGLQAAAGIEVAVLHAVDEDLHALLAGLQPADHIQSAQPRDSQFEDHQFRLPLARQLQRIQAVVGLGDDFVPTILQKHPQRPPNDGQAVHDHDPAQWSVPNLCQWEKPRPPAGAAGHALIRASRQSTHPVGCNPCPRPCAP
ncbi:hypothetical protein D9M71_343420 [compost metagenome]